jgi:hypothetical protein
MLSLGWVKYQSGEWCDLLGLDLSQVSASGVYVIWQGGLSRRCVRVGSGIIRERLSAHRNDEDILAYQEHGLYVTWASVHPNQQLDVEAFRAGYYQPLVGERFPNRTQIPVNLPGATVPSSSLLR